VEEATYKEWKQRKQEKGEKLTSARVGLFLHNQRQYRQTDRQTDRHIQGERVCF